MALVTSLRSESCLVVGDGDADADADAVVHRLLMSSSVLVSPVFFVMLKSNSRIENRNSELSQ